MEAFDSLLKRIWYDGRSYLPPKHLFPWAVTSRDTLHGSRSLVDVAAEKAWIHGLETQSYLVTGSFEDVVVVYPPNWKGADWSWARDKLWRAMEEEMRKPPPLTQDELRDDPC